MSCKLLTTYHSVVASIWGYRHNLLSLLATVVLALLTSYHSHAQTPPANQTEILWDTFGVPHIFAKDEPGLFHAFGWAQMHSHGDLLLQLYGKSRGRAAEYWGPENLDSDRWVRTNGIPERARLWEQAQTDSFRRNLEAFAAGVNAYAAKHADRIADDVEVVLPITAADLLAHAQHVIHFTFVASPEIVSAVSQQVPAKGGSNAWAIGPTRSASKNAMLLANPHLPWNERFLFYEAQLNVAGTNAYGATLVGSPVLGIAFNDFLGWSHTVNRHDGQDLYALTLAEGGYRFDGQTRPFETDQQVIKVKQPDGTFRDEALTVRRSVHGPVIAEANGKAIALRIVGLDDARIGEQQWQMMSAKNLPEFETALKQLQIPMFTVMYADRDGHIMHLFGGRTPVRPPGDYDWSGIVPGDTSQTLWTKTHAYDELPRIVDPKSGWLQNANDPPWTTTFPTAIDPNKFPPYMSTRLMSLRAQHSARLLADDDSITFQEMIEYKHSTRLELADRILDDLFQAVQTDGNETTRRAAKVLESWDRCTEATSRGAPLFVFFGRELFARDRAGLYKTRWQPADPRSTPRGLANPQVALAALEAAALHVEKTYGSLDVPWGQVARLQAGEIDLPANGGSGEFGAFRVVGFQPAKDGRLRAVGGDSYVAAVEFSNPVKARALLSYGNSSQPQSPHRTDQLPYFSRKELRPVWRTRDEIMKHLEHRDGL